MRKYLLSLYFIFIFFSTVSTGSWQNVGGDLQHSGYSDSPYVPLELIWKYKVGGSDISAPIVDRGTLFVGSDDNNLYAIEAGTGKLKWQYSALGKVYTPAAKDGLVFAASFDNYIYALDSNGDLRWKASTGSSMASPPVAYNNILYGGSDKDIYAIYIINGSIKWKYATGGSIESTPAISQGIVYAGSNDNKVYALDAGNKNLRWSYPTGGSISSSPSVINGIVYVGSKDNNIYAIDSIDGKLKWSKKTNDWVRSSPAVFGNKVFVGSNDNNVYALNTDNGDVIWNYRTNGRVESPPVVVRGALYAGSEDGVIYSLSPENGKLIDKYEIGKGIISLALSENILFATSRDGYVYAFGTQVSETETTVPSVLIEKTPPVLRIDPVPVNVTSEKLMISGTAEDPSGIMVVTVNGMDAGTNIWNATLTLIPGPNTIIIVAVDGAGNIKTQTLIVTYIGSAEPQEKETVKIPGFYAFFSLIGFIFSIYLIKQINRG
ncbi:MAG: PQQ-binding-like beta-propeller repeat protein [Methanobacteriota archaeon]